MSDIFLSIITLIGIVVFCALILFIISYVSYIQHPPYIIFTNIDDAEIANVYIFECNYKSGGSYNCYRFESVEGKWNLVNKKPNIFVLGICFLIILAILTAAIIKNGDLSLQSLLACAFYTGFLTIFVILCYVYAGYRAKRIFKKLLKEKNK